MFDINLMKGKDMQFLRKLGFNRHQIDELVDMIINNKDYHHSFSTAELSFPVSPLFVSRSKHPGLHINKLKAINIHNILMMQIDTKNYHFKAVSCDGELYTFDLPRSKNRKEVIFSALEQIIKKFNNR